MHITAFTFKRLSSMNVPKKILVSILCLLIVGCLNEKNSVDPYYGELSCTINGVPWTGSLRPFDRDSVMEINCSKIKMIDDVKVPWESLNIQYIRKKLISQTIYAHLNPPSYKTESTFVTAQDDGDVACDYYKVIEDDSLTNHFIIDSLKNDYKEIWGTFNINFLRLFGCPLSSYPDTLRIRDGIFHIKFGQH